jgi:hypothetical protein
MSGWALYNAWVGAQTTQYEADLAYERAVQAGGPLPDAAAEASTEARLAEHDADVAWDLYSEAWAEARSGPPQQHPEPEPEPQPEPEI